MHHNRILLKNKGMIIVLYCKLKVQMDYTFDKDIVFVDFKVLENEVSHS